MGVGHLYVVTEHAVITYFEAWYGCGFALAALYLEQIVLTLICKVTQVVELGVHPRFYGVAAVELRRRVVGYFACDAFANETAGVELLGHGPQGLAVGLLKGCLDGFDGLEGSAHLYHFAGSDAVDRHFRDKAFEVAYLLEVVVERVAQIGLAEEIFHHIEAGVDAFGVFQRE